MSTLSLPLLPPPPPHTDTTWLKCRLWAHSLTSYSMDGSGMGSALLYGSTDNGTTYDQTLWSQSGDQGSGWKGVNVTVTSDHPQVLRVRVKPI